MKIQSKLALREWTAIVVAVAALVALAMKITALNEKPQTPDYGKAPVFRFQDRNGAFIQTSDLVGKFWVADFIFTRCAGSCPVLGEQMRQLQKQWKGNPRLDLVTFTVDPEYDTMAVLKGYADDLGADPQQWFFLTGAKKDLLKNAEEGFRLTAIEDPGAAPGALFIHSTKLVLVGPDGTILDYYDGTDPVAVDKLKTELKEVL